jgi:hypothetical protein
MKRTWIYPTGETQNCTQGFLCIDTTQVGAEDTLELVSRDHNNITVADITQLYVREQDNPELLHHAAHLKHIRSNDFRLTSCCFPLIRMIKSRLNSKNLSGVYWAIAEE